MKFSCKYNMLVSHITSVRTVVEDPQSNEDMRNIIFKFEKTETGFKATLIGVSKNITYKEKLDESDYTFECAEDELKDGVLMFQLKSKELSDYLNAYKGVRKTKIDDIILDFGERNMIRCTVIEKLNDSDATYTSRWHFNNIPIKPNMLPSINMTAPDVELESVDNLSLSFATTCLIPNLQAGDQTYSCLLFSEKDIVTIGSTYTTIMKNNVVDEDNTVFKNMRFVYKSAELLDKLVSDKSGATSFAKMDGRIYVSSERQETIDGVDKVIECEAFISYDEKIANYQTFKDAYRKDSYFVLDRLYLKDVLKRLSLVNESIEVQIKADEGVVTLRNSKFSQDIPMSKQESLDDMRRVNFKLLPGVLSKAIIGDDNLMCSYNPDTYIYLNRQNANSFVVVFADNSDLWFSVVRTNTY